MVQINNSAWNDRPVPYGVKSLQCLKNNKDTSLEIKLVNVMRMLLVRFKSFNGLVYYGFEMKKVSEINRESVQSHPVLDMMARPVSRGGIQEDWPASPDSETTGSFGALTENRLETFYNAGALVKG